MQVAILVPTFNRPSYVIALLKYYEELKAHHPIYIGDASPESVAQPVVEFIKTLKNIEVHYFNWVKLGANQTIVKLAEKASEKYTFCSISGDDDFFVPNSLVQCAQYLEKFKDYRMVLGYAGLVDTSTENFLIEDYWGKHSLESSSAFERLNYFNFNYHVLQFAVHRTQEFLQDSSAYLNVKDDMVGELLHNYTFILRGKSKFLECLLIIRTVHKNTFHPDFVNWTLRDSWSVDMNYVIGELASILAESSTDKNKAELSVMIKKLFSDKFKEQVVNELKAKNMPIYKKIYRALLSMIPFWLKRSIKAMFYSKNDMSILVNKKSQFHEDFRPIYDNLKNFKHG